MNIKREVEAIRVYRKEIRMRKEKISKLEEQADKIVAGQHEQDDDSDD